MKTSKRYRPSLDGVIKTFKIIVHENLGIVILNCKRKDQILASYASQKYSMNKKNVSFSFFYIAQNISNISSITEKSLMNHIVIHFKAFLIPITISECIKKRILVFVDYFPTQTEIECRRYINSYNLLLKRILGISCNDLSNMKYIERNIEIVLNNDNDDNDNNNNNKSYYRCIINIDKGYSIQLKYYHDQKETFINKIKSFEILHYNEESFIFDDSHYFLAHSKDKTIIGLASFLDCNNVSVKTVYLNDTYGTVLYQRILLDDYKNHQPFILEHEFTSPTNVASLKNYFKISCILNAKLCNIHKNGYSNTSSKPIHLNYNYNINNDSRRYIMLKLDGILANLKFYNHHFIISSNIKSESFPHSLPKRIIHRIKDFTFMIESDLYETRFPKTYSKPHPLAIIDLYTTSFTAIERMDIIQKIKKVAAKYLQEYFIFFQDEKYYNNMVINKNILYPNILLKDFLTPKLKTYLEKNFIHFVKCKDNDDDIIKNNHNNNNNNLKLQHGKIYEVYINANYNVEHIIKLRADKIHPNSRKCVENVVKNIRKK